MRRWYNNSIKEILVYDDKPIPEGFVPGRLPLSDEHKQKISKGQLGREGGFKGKHHTEESKQKTSKTLLDGYASGRIIHKEQVVWNKGLTGVQVAWNKGISYYETHSIEDKEKMIEKIFDTKRKNHSWNTSKPEEEFNDFLVNLFSKEDVIRNYSDERYPTRCDFYIRSLDIFIELNLHPSHFTHPFDNSNVEDIEYFAKLKESNDRWSKMILDVWGDRDIQKLNIAKKNKLNYYTCYSNEEVQRLSKLLVEKKNLYKERVE